MQAPAAGKLNIVNGERMNESAYPVIVPLPGENGSNGYAEGKLKERMERALGVDILFGREDK